MYAADIVRYSHRGNEMRREAPMVTPFAVTKHDAGAGVHRLMVNATGIVEEVLRISGADRTLALTDEPDLPGT